VLAPGRKSSGPVSGLPEVENVCSILAPDGPRMKTSAFGKASPTRLPDKLDRFSLSVRSMSGARPSGIFGLLPASDTVSIPSEGLALILTSATSEFDPKSTEHAVATHLDPLLNASWPRISPVARLTRTRPEIPVNGPTLGIQDSRCAPLWDDCSSNHLTNSLPRIVPVSGSNSTLYEEKELTTSGRLDEIR